MVWLELLYSITQTRSLNVVLSSLDWERKRMWKVPFSYFVNKEIVVHFVGEYSSGTRWLHLCVLAGSSLCLPLHGVCLVQWWECWMISVSEIFFFYPLYIESLCVLGELVDMQNSKCLQFSVLGWTTELRRDHISWRFARQRFRQLNQAHLLIRWWPAQFRVSSCT